MDYEFPPENLSQLLDILKRDTAAKGMPDSGPFMWDRIKKLGKYYHNLAPPLTAPDPYANFPKEPLSGYARSFPLSSMMEGNKYPYMPSIQENI
jgi:hypothetical protein